MSALTLTAGATPAFLDGNIFNRHADKGSDLSVTSGSSLKARLYDMDPASRWQSAGSSDGVSEVVEAGLWVPGARLLQSVDYIAVMNHNAETLTIETSANNGGSWTSRYSASGLTASRTRVSLSSPVDAERIRITIPTTQTADEEKKIGSVIVGLKRFQSLWRPFKMDREPWMEGERVARMHDNSIRSNKIYRSAASFKLWGAEFGFLADTAAEITNFQDLHATGKSFLFMPEPGDELDEIYLCRIRPKTFDDNYMKLSKSGGRGIRMVLEEVGGA